MEAIFKYIEKSSNNNYNYLVRASFLQIYNENISDLLNISNTRLEIREDKKLGIKVDLLSEWAVRNPNEIYQLMKAGSNNRVTATTKMNDVSSRSHAVFIITVEQSEVSFRDEYSNEISQYEFEMIKNKDSDSGA